MEVIFLDVWVVLAFYSALCIWIPEIRLFGWRNSDAKFGTVSYVGLLGSAITSVAKWITSTVDGAATVDS